MELIFKKSEKLLSEKIRDIIVWGIPIFFVVTFLFPLISLSVKATEDNAGNFIGLQNFIQYLTSPGVVSSFFDTVKIATLTMFITLILGFGYSYGMARSNIKGKGILKFLILLPIFAPTMLHSISLVYLFGRMGVITLDSLVDSLIFQRISIYTVQLEL